jgi:hypothetical protein
MCIGNACLPNPLIFFFPQPPANLDLDRAPYRIAGVVGNVPFDGRFTVILDSRHRRFGLFAGSLAAVR